MGFLASFYGSQAQSHQQTTQEWKRLWQADEQLRQQEENAHLEQQYRRQDIQLRREAAEDSRHQFTVNERLADARLAHESNQLDAEYAGSLIAQLQPGFDGASRLGKTAMVDSLRQSVGDNEFIQGYVDAWEASINQQAMSVADAREGLTQYFQGAIRDANGNLWVPPTPLVEEYLAVMEAESPAQGAAWRAEYEAKREAVEAGNDYLFDAQRQGITLANLRTQAEIGNIEADTLYIGSRTLSEDQQRTHTADMFASALTASEAGARLAELEVEDKTARLAVLEDFLRMEYGKLEAEVRGLELGNEFEEAVFDNLVTKLAHETNLLESQVRVALATEEFTIRGAELELDRAEAVINQIKSATDLADAQRNDSLMSLGLTMAEAGNAEVVEALGEQFFGHISGWEEVMGPIVEMAKSEQEQRRSAVSAEIALRQNQAADVAETTRLREASLYAVSSGTRGISSAVPLGKTDAHNAARLAFGANLTEILDIRDEAIEIDNGINALLRVRENSGNSSALVESLEGMLAQYGITPPKGATGQWDDAAIDHAITLLIDRRSSIEQAAGTRMNLYYDMFTSGGGPVETIDSMFNLELSGVEDTVDSRILQSIYSHGPAGNAAAAATRQDSAEAAALMDAFGGDAEFIEYATGVMNIALADIAASTPHGAFLSMDLATQIYEDFLNDDFYGDTRSQRQALLQLAGWSSPGDIAREVDAMRQDIVSNSETIYGMQGLPIFRGAQFDLTSNAGVNNVVAHVSGATSSLNRVSELGRELTNRGSGSAPVAAEIAQLLNSSVPDLVRSGVLVEDSRTAAGGTVYYAGPNFQQRIQQEREAVNTVMSAASRLSTIYGKGIGPQ